MSTLHDTKPTTTAPETYDAEKSSLADVTTIPVPEDISPEDDARLRRRIDWHLLPLFCVIYCLQYVDKVAMSYAAIMGFREANHLSLAQYSWLGSIFYIGYVVGEYPMCLLMQKLPLSKLSAVNIVLWGGVLCLMAAVPGFHGLMVVRFLLGFFESAITPGLALFTGQWYRLREQGTRTGLWYSMLGFGYILGGASSYGLAKANLRGDLSIPGWKVVYVMFGLATSVVGILMWFLIPDTIDTAWFLTPADRELAKRRTRENQQPTSTKWSWPQFREAMADPLTWLYCIVCLLCSIPNGITTNFFTIIIKDFGFDSLQTLLLGMVGSWVVVNYCFWLWFGDRVGNRCLSAMPPCCVSIIGFAIMYATPEHKRMVRLAGYYICVPWFVTVPIALSLITSNVAGKTKKTTVNALFFISYCIGNLVGPQAYQQRDAPRFMPLYLTCILSVGLSIVTMVAIYVVYRVENAKRDRIESAAGPRQFNPEDDLTDRMNPHFRYTY
ncbi:putative transporter [Vanrija pseudolonga]|uniref:Purtative transporter n=1 Tax=Vanrija pseudolonga TaxID=143232 RepID=A0AAF0Y3J7_9TREE|nr:purtative transporter [Vanrija pseudolonga]